MSKRERESRINEKKIQTIFILQLLTKLKSLEIASFSIKLIENIIFILRHAKKQKKDKSILVCIRTKTKTRRKKFTKFVYKKKNDDALNET